ncbi:MAG TPA: hypothetical protein VGM13_15260 [Thermoanaerobaculia bacterium]
MRRPLLLPLLTAALLGLVPALRAAGPAPAPATVNLKAPRSLPSIVTPTPASAKK